MYGIHIFGIRACVTYVLFLIYPLLEECFLEEACPDRWCSAAACMQAQTQPNEAFCVGGLVGLGNCAQ